MISTALLRCIKESSPVIVAGMHRSGTSMVSRILQSASVFMGKHLSPNVESLFFQDLNRRLLDILGCSWKHLDSLPSACDILKTEASLLSKAKSAIDNNIIAGHFGWYVFRTICIPGSMWGWKDPRNSLLLPIWISVFKNARVIVLMRDGRDVALSLLSRDHRRKKFANPSGAPNELIDFKAYFNLWDAYCRRICECNDQFGRAYFIRYENLVQEPQECLINLARFLGNKRVCTDAAIAQIRRNTKPKYLDQSWITDDLYDCASLNRFGYR